ncbi:MAG: galactosyltransferase-related protein [Phormidesmis sp.]
MNRVSVLTLTRDRTSHLYNLLRGLARASQLPDECIIVHMNEPAQPLGIWPFPCRQYSYQDDDTLLPLAKARNYAAQQATGDILIFLDVDCIPSRKLVAAYETACRQARHAIMMSSVQYLSKKIKADWTESLLIAQSKPNPKRNISAVAELIIEPSYGLFWSLSFALHRALFEQLGGFSECYLGYGAEDTDFAWKAKQAGILLMWVPAAMAFHQYHPSCVPPWKNFESIVRNARIFHERWGQWPMAGWLEIFAEQGYINWTDQGNKLEIVQLPKIAT